VGKLPLAGRGAIGPTGMAFVVAPSPKRLVDLRVAPGGNALYTVDIGAFMVVPTAIGPVARPFPKTGVVWRVKAG
jgi:hypothetical protein